MFILKYLYALLPFLTHIQINVHRAMYRTNFGAPPYLASSYTPEHTYMQPIVDSINPNCYANNITNCPSKRHIFELLWRLHSVYLRQLCESSATVYVKEIFD